MSSSYKPHILIYNQDGATAIAKGMAVKLSTDKKHVTPCTAATDKVIGIAQNATANSGDPCEVALPGGGGKALLGSGGCAMGDALTSDGSGNLIVTTSAGNHVIATAMDSGSQGDLVSAHVVRYNYS